MATIESPAAAAIRQLTDEQLLMMALFVTVHIKHHGSPHGIVPALLSQVIHAWSFQPENQADTLAIGAVFRDHLEEINARFPGVPQRG